MFIWRHHGARWIRRLLILALTSTCFLLLIVLGVRSLESRLTKSVHSVAKSVFFHSCCSFRSLGWSNCVFIFTPFICVDEYFIRRCNPCVCPRFRWATCSLPAAWSIDSCYDWVFSSVPTFCSGSIISGKRFIPAWLCVMDLLGVILSFWVLLWSQRKDWQITHVFGYFHRFFYTTRHRLS